VTTLGYTNNSFLDFESIKNSSLQGLKNLSLLKYSAIISVIRKSLSLFQTTVDMACQNEQKAHYKTK